MRIADDSRRIPRPVLLDATSPEARLLDEVDACYQRADVFYGRVFVRPAVAIDISGKRAGEYQFQKASHLLRFNRTLLHQEGDQFIGQTVAHEVAHHLACVIHGPHIGHDPEWQQIMVDVFHKPPDRCHDYDVSFTVREAYIYMCDCRRELALSKIRHSRILHGKSYSCRWCKGKLRFLHRRDPKSGDVSRALAIQGLFVAVDDGWRDGKLFESRMSAVLRGEKPGNVVTFNDPNAHPVLAGWISQHRFWPTGPLRAEHLLKARDQKLRVTHAVGFTSTSTSEIARQIGILADSGVSTRLLKI
mgnify:FL=1